VNLKKRVKFAFFVLFFIFSKPSMLIAQNLNLGTLESVYENLSGYISELGASASKDWRLRIGAAMGAAPDFSGSDQYEIKFLPVFQFRYKKNLLIDPLGIRLQVWENSCCRLFIQTGLSPGRSPDPDSKVSLLPDFSTGADVGAYFEGRFARFIAFRLRVRKEVAGGHGGLRVSSSLGTVVRRETFRLIPEIYLQWSDNTYMDAYYGIPVSSADATGYESFDPSPDFDNMALRMTAFFNVAEDWQLLLRAEAGLLVGDAGRTPFVREDGDRFRGLLGLGFLYTF